MRIIYVLTKGHTEAPVVVIAPAGEFKPKTGADLLAELNKQLPFQVEPRRFICRVKDGKLVGWAVLGGDDQKNIVKTKLEASKSLRLLQVEATTPEFEQVLDQNWKQSQTITAP